ncbi:hypothetical protein [Rhizobium leguminosarum]|uniref:hypothetical protein n=1 Tax=Rhizobium leguminosarum TaxID=384 RepID=UPI003F9D6C1A
MKAALLKSYGAAVRGLLVIPISHTFTLDEIGAAQNAVAAACVVARWTKCTV